MDKPTNAMDDGDNLLQKNNTWTPDIPPQSKNADQAMMMNQTQKMSALMGSLSLLMLRITHFEYSELQLGSQTLGVI